MKIEILKPKHGLRIGAKDEIVLPVIAAIFCPDCGCRLVPSSGCAHCPCCGWSVCS